VEAAFYLQGGGGGGGGLGGGGGGGGGGGRLPRTTAQLSTSSAMLVVLKKSAQREERLPSKGRALPGPILNDSYSNKNLLTTSFEGLAPSTDSGVLKKQGREVSTSPKESRDKRTECRGD